MSRYKCHDSIVLFVIYGKISYNLIVYYLLNITMSPKKSYQSQTQKVNISEEQAQVLHIFDTRWLIGVMIIIILEVSTPIGMLFPTDAIVFGSGMYFSAKGNIPWGIVTIMVLFSIAVIIWDLLWYRRWTLLSPRLQVMQDNRFFKKKYLTMCQHYFDDYGDKTMIVSKFLPIRSIISLVAGVLNKPFPSFLIQSILSAILRVWVLVGVSYFLILLIPSAANHVALLTFLFVVIPQIISLWYMFGPLMKKYEARITQASENIHHIAESISAIGSQFTTITHEVSEIVHKVVEETPTPVVPNLNPWVSSEWLPTTTNLS